MNLDIYGTLMAASLVLLLGGKLVAWTPPLRAYSIPEPVAGGLLVALAVFAAHAFAGYNVSFDTRMQTPLLLTFFASIGLNADLASLKLGGRKLVVFLCVVLGLLFMQDLVGVVLASVLGFQPHVGLLAGSIALSGGHGTGAAWGALFVERHGVHYAIEIAMACATFGLVLGGIVGGPVAKFLVGRVPKPAGWDDAKDEPTIFEHPGEDRRITAPAVIETIALVAVSLLCGNALSGWLRGSALELPAFVCALFVGVLLRNGLQALGCYSVFDRAVSVLGNVALSLFLAMALMTLRIWDLSALALPMLLLLAAQTALMVSYAIFVTFRIMGKNYDAAVIAAGHCGFGLGATPTAIANMQAVTDRYGPSRLAFLIVPLVGAFFIDIANALIIKLFLALPHLQ
ncbi:sodium/glutamate symporter [Chthoniobacter flavus Ellin428]|uniref:Sodium/glutamate symporter n=1 Tax=Chthoniobacter flavus Ellin428 TaxID=497964 RepID=B4DB01_9BACT|nr:sodium/glutamate symporter [Chthoniobacter flavus]EDY16375.1 sodium/glutamate symporter [Chthoniobacter flavus Ellin428]TCO92464.1 ESS family glutamate:Na+ symporter [Chthoniobacter flavus]